ncbi:MAG: RHS repeat protein, partial [Myxococcaceae bacterium]|nr:RHS repeat protein [Myxococcaceae bacterium]
RLAHVWVEAFLPFAEYRGFPGAGRRQWVPIEPSFTGGAKLSFTAGAADVFAEMGETAQSLTDAYLASPPGVAFLAFVRARVEAHLAVAHPGMTWADIQGAVTQRAESLEFLPGSLPYKVVGTDGEHAFLPGAWLHHLRVTAHDEQGPLVEQLLPLHQVVSHRAVWTYKAATPADDELIATAGGLYAAPASAVRLLPVLRLDGVERVAATRSVGLGATHTWALELVLPGGSAQRVENTIVAGNLVAIGLSAPRNAYAEPAEVAAGDLDGPAPRALYAAAAAYANGWTEAEDELSKVLGTRLVRRAAGVVLVENQLVVEESLGVRTRVAWKGLEMDADLRTATAVSTVAGRAGAFMRLSGHQGSFLEAKALADATGEESVSATGVLQHAAAQGISVLTITPANAAVLLPQVSAPAGVLRDLADAIARGREVRVPAVEVDMRDWSGTAFIVRDVVTEEGGYFLSGVVSGGMTVVSPLSWLNQSVVQALSNPNPPPTVNDPARAERIVALPLADPIGDMGAAKRVRVVVTTLDGRPVTNVPVTFRQNLPSTPTFHPAPAGAQAPPPGPGQVQLVVQTDLYGVASAFVVLDTDPTHGGINMSCNLPEPCRKDPSPGYTPVDEIFGLTRVMATARPAPSPGNPTPADLQLPLPILIAARPGPPSVVRVLRSSAVAEPGGLAINGNLLAVVWDEWGNALANRAIEWSQSPGDGRYYDLEPQGQIRRLDPSDPTQQLTFTTHSSTAGVSELGYITPAAQPPSGPVQVVATVAPPTGSTSPPAVGRLAVPVDGDATVTMRARFLGGTLRSVQGADFPGPVLLQAFQRSGATWSVISPATPDVVSYSGTHRVFTRDNTNATAGQALRVETREVAQNLSGVALDDDSVVAFWPRYELTDNLGQADDFRLKIRANSPTGEYQLCCDESLVVNDTAPPLKVDRITWRVGDFVQPISGAASAGDFRFGFRVGNLGGTPVYLRLAPGAANVIQLPGPGELARHPSDPNLLALAPNLTTDLLFVPNNVSGGTLEVSFEAQAPSLQTAPATRPITRLTFNAQSAHPGPYSLPVMPATPTLRVASGAEVQQATQTGGVDFVLPTAVSPVLQFPMRTFETMGASAPALGPCDELGPTATQGAVAVRSNASGTLVAFRGISGSGASSPAVEIARAELSATAAGVQSLNVVSGALSLLADGNVLLKVDPQLQGGDEITFRLEPTGGAPPVLASAEVPTRIVDRGAMPIGHTFVKEVSTADGHLTKSSVDVSLPGRGIPLRLSRSYTSSGFERTPLGFGWTHSYRTYLESLGPNATNTHRKFIIAGAEGGAQQFCCTASGSACTPQRGYHGKLEQVPPPSGQGASVWRYTSKGGVQYWFDNDSLERRRLAFIADTTGEQRTELEYSPLWGGEVKRVWEPGDRRFLEFEYAQGPKGVQLRRVELMSNPRPTRLQPDEPGLPLAGAEGLCVAYEYTDGTGNVNAVHRGHDCIGAPLKTETYTYDLSSPRPQLQNNLIEHVEPNGAKTSYTYYSLFTPLLGESSFQGFAGEEKAERVREVIEHLGATPLVTQFSYELIPKPSVGPLGTTLTYATHVTPARPNVPPTSYLMGPYGAVLETRRPLSATDFAVTQERLNEDRLRIAEVDARGRLTTMKYDARGNLIERRVATGALPPRLPTELPATAVVDETGTPITEAVEKWAYDADFSIMTCHVDASGRGQLQDVAKGRVTRVRKLASRVSQASLAASTSDCEALLTPLLGGDDIITTSAYHGIGTPPGPTATGSQVGDLTRTTDGNGNLTRYDDFDDYGHAHTEQLTGAGSVSITTTHTFDSRGRRLTTEDSMGQATARAYDGLDRLTRLEQKN